jgi:hypothetical protein
MSNTYTYKVGIVFGGLSHGLHDAVSAALPGAAFREAGGVTTVTAKIIAPGPAAAISRLEEPVRKAAPAAVPLRVDPDLVTVSNIARRVGRSRESVRLLVDGKRGPGGFPAPLGVVGEGTRVWPWSVALEWFDQALGVDLGERGVLPEAAAVLDAGFAARRSPGLATAVGNRWFT